MSHFLRATLPKKQIQLIDETLALYENEELKYHTSAEACVTSGTSKKLKYLSSLLVVSKFRIFVFSKNKMNEKDFPILFLTKISGKGPKVNFLFSAHKQSLCVSACEDAMEFVQHVYDCNKRITFGWPKDVECTCEYIADSTFIPNFDINPSEPGPARGFVNTYEAYCNAWSSPVRADFLAHIKELDEEEITDLNLNECPGIHPKSGNPLDLKPVAYALRYNTYFTGLEIRDMENKDTAMCIASVLMSNTTITRFVCINSGLEIPEHLASALSQNSDHQVQVIQFSGNRFSAKSADLFARSLVNFPHILNVLDLSNCSLGNSGILYILDSLKVNWGMTLGMQQLSLANNQIGEAPLNDFMLVLGGIRRFGSLKRLSLANIGVITGVLLQDLGFLKLTYLDISDNRFDKSAVGSIVHYCENIQGLETLRLAGTLLPVEIFSRALKALFQNESVQTISIDLSRNNLGPQGGLALASIFKEKGSRFDTLDMADNNLKEKAGLEIVKNIQFVRRLILDKNFLEQSEPLASALGAMVSSHPELYSLSIAGNPGGNKFGKSLKPFFAYLNKNTTLEELDISGNAIGDAVFASLCSALRWASIRSLKCDGNGISYSGYLSLRLALRYNKAFRHLQLPVLDSEQEKDIKSRQIFLELLVDTISENRYKKKKEVPLWLPNIFDFDQKWPTPTQKPSPLHRVPSELPTTTANLLDPKNINLPEETSGTWFFSSLSPRRKRKEDRESSSNISRGVQTARDPDREESATDLSEEDGANNRKLKRRYSEGGSEKDVDKRERYFRQKSEKQIRKTLNKPVKRRISDSSSSLRKLGTISQPSDQKDGVKDKRDPSPSQRSSSTPHKGSPRKNSASEGAPRISPRKKKEALSPRKSVATPKSARWKENVGTSPRRNSPATSMKNSSTKHKRIASNLKESDGALEQHLDNGTKGVEVLGGNPSS